MPWAGESPLLLVVKGFVCHDAVMCVFGLSRETGEVIRSDSELKTQTVFGRVLARTSRYLTVTD